MHGLGSVRKFAANPSIVSHLHLVSFESELKHNSSGRA